MVRRGLKGHVRPMSSLRGMKEIQGGMPEQGRWICMSVYYPLEHLTNTSRMIRILKRTWSGQFTERKRVRGLVIKLIQRLGI